MAGASLLETHLALGPVKLRRSGLGVRLCRSISVRAPDNSSSGSLVVWAPHFCPALRDCTITNHVLSPLQQRFTHYIGMQSVRKSGDDCVVCMTCCSVCDNKAVLEANRSRLGIHVNTVEPVACKRVGATKQRHCCTAGCVHCESVYAVKVSVKEHAWGKCVTKCPCCTIQLAIAIVCSLCGNHAQTHILVAFGDPGLSRSHHDELLVVKACSLRWRCSCCAAERAYALHSGTRHCKHIQAPTWGECFPGFLTLVITKASCVMWVGSLKPCKGCILSEYQISCRASWLLEFMSDDCRKWEMVAACLLGPASAQLITLSGSPLGSEPSWCTLTRVKSAASTTPSLKHWWCRVPTY